MNNILQKTILVILLISIFIIIVLGIIIIRQNKEIKSKNTEIQNFILKKEALSKKEIEVQDYLQQKDKMKNKISKLERELKEAKEILPEKHPIEIKVQDCMQNCNYTTACMSNCVNDSIVDWEKISKESILEFKKILNSERYALLIDSQEKWQTYKKAHVKFLSNTIGNLQGTMYVNITTGEIADIYEQRARNLHAILQNVKQGSFISP